MYKHCSIHHLCSRVPNINLACILLVQTCSSWCGGWCTAAPRPPPWLTPCCVIWHWAVTSSASCQSPPCLGWSGCSLQVNMRCTPHDCILLHVTVLHYIWLLHYILMNYTPYDCFAPHTHCTALHCTALHCTVLHSTKWQSHAVPCTQSCVKVI